MEDEKSPAVCQPVLELVVNEDLPGHRQNGLHHGAIQESIVIPNGQVHSRPVRCKLKDATQDQIAGR